jgi:hypothetical protein
MLKNKHKILTCFLALASAQNIITTIAGNGTNGYTGDGAAATTAEWDN